MNKQQMTDAPAIDSTLKFGSNDWRVLDVQDDRALLINKDVTHVNMPYNKTFADVTWETCTLRNWLNNDFLSTFSPQEQSRICLSTIANENNPWYGTSGGLNTKDRIFLLSISEVVKYFGDSGDLANKRRKDEFGILKSEGSFLKDNNCYARKVDYIGKPAWYVKSAWWWLRSPGCYSSRAASVDADGAIGVGGDAVNIAGYPGGVRPALWLNL